jgi:DNA-binding XRE family transcriptional regulator
MGSQWKRLPETERAICLRFAESRKQAGFEQAELAKKIGVGRDVIVNIENCRVPLKWPVFCEVLKVFAVNPVWLATGTGPMFFDVGLAGDLPATKEGALFSAVYEERLPYEILPAVAGFIAAEIERIQKILETPPASGQAKAIIIESMAGLVRMTLVLLADAECSRAAKDLSVYLTRLACDREKWASRNVISTRYLEIMALSEQWRREAGERPPVKRAGAPD